MSTPARHANDSRKSVVAFSKLSRPQCKIASPVARGVNPFAASSFEFVAKPEEAASAVLDLPAAIQSPLEGFAGFTGSLVMVSDLETRLITVINSGKEVKRNGVAPRACARCWLLTCTAACARKNRWHTCRLRKLFQSGLVLLTRTSSLATVWLGRLAPVSPRASV